MRSAGVLCPGRCTHAGPGHGQGSRAAAQGSGQGTWPPLSRTERGHDYHAPTSPQTTAEGALMHPRGSSCLLSVRTESKAFESKESLTQEPGSSHVLHRFLTCLCAVGESPPSSPSPAAPSSARVLLALSPASGFPSPSLRRGSHTSCVPETALPAVVNPKGLEQWSNSRENVVELVSGLCLMHRWDGQEASTSSLCSPWWARGLWSLHQPRATQGLHECVTLGLVCHITLCMVRLRPRTDLSGIEG